MNVPFFFSKLSIIVDNTWKCVVIAFLSGNSLFTQVNSPSFKGWLFRLTLFLGQTVSHSGEKIPLEYFLRQSVASTPDHYCTWLLLSYTVPYYPNTTWSKFSDKNQSKKLRPTIDGEELEVVCVFFACSSFLGYQRGDENFLVETLIESCFMILSVRFSVSALWNPFFVL